MRFPLFALLQVIKSLLGILKAFFSLSFVGDEVMLYAC